MILKLKLILISNSIFSCSSWSFLDWQC